MSRTLRLRHARGEGTILHLLHEKGNARVFRTRFTAHTRVSETRRERMANILEDIEGRGGYLPGVYPLLQKITADTAEDLRTNATNSLLGKRVRLIDGVVFWGSHRERISETIITVADIRINERPRPDLARRLCPEVQKIAGPMVLPELVLVCDKGVSYTITDSTHVYH